MAGVFVDLLQSSETFGENKSLPSEQRRVYEYIVDLKTRLQLSSDIALAKQSIY